MKTRILAVAGALVLLSAPALAFRCPSDVAAIDKALAAGSDLSVGRYAEVMISRFDGEALHKDGRHVEAVAMLAKTLDILKADKERPPPYYCVSTLHRPAVAGATQTG